MAGATLRTRPHEVALPPGQRVVEGFPRFGTHLHHPPPAIPSNPVIEICGAVREPTDFPVEALATRPRREVLADFHCVAGWSATGLRWEGVGFDTFYRTVIVPMLVPGAAVTHVVFGGLDRFRSVVDLEDALQEDVLIADRLDGIPLDSDHGAPVRLVSPSQYGYMSVKHLCRIELHTVAPKMKSPAAVRIGPLTLRTPLIKTHPRARVWKEERHPDLPASALRPLYRLTIPLIMRLSRRGSRVAIKPRR